MSEISDKTEKKENRRFKKWRFVNNSLDKITSIALVLILLIGVYCIYDSLYVFGYTGDNLAYFFEGGKEDWSKLPDNAIGWLTLEDTTVNYPVMQGKDNDEYLNKDAFGNYSLMGSIFLDWRSTPDWSDKYNLLYGHHMEGKKMFGALDYYKEADYLESHSKGELKTRGADYDLEVFAVMDSNAEENKVFDAGEDTYGKILDFIKENSSYYREPSTDKILAMSTCQDASTTERLIVFASMKKTREPGTLYDTDNLVEPE